MSKQKLYMIAITMPDGERMTDVDLTEDMVRQAKENAPKLGITIDYIEEQPDVNPAALGIFGVEVAR